MLFNMECMLVYWLQVVIKDSRTFFNPNIGAVANLPDDAGHLSLGYVSDTDPPHRLQDIAKSSNRILLFYNRPRVPTSDNLPKARDVSDQQSLKAQILKYLNKPTVLSLFQHSPVTKRYNGATTTGSPTTWIEYQKSSAPLDYSKLHFVKVIIFSIFGVLFWCSMCAWGIWGCMMCAKKRKAKRAERKMKEHMQGQSIEQADEMAMAVW